MQAEGNVIQPDEMPMLNVGRWCSAVVVAYGHLFLLIYPAFPFRVSLLGGLLVAAAKLRYLAVSVFFVISGYLIGGSLLTSQRAFSWRRYAVARFARIYLPLIPALVLTVGLDALGSYFASGASIYTVVWPTHVIGPTAPMDNYSLWNGIAAITSLESVLGDPLGSNSPLWSLGLEWSFYFIFPLLFISLPLSNRLAWHVAAVLIIGAMLWVVIGGLAATWLIWCSGALVRRWLPPVTTRIAVLALVVSIGSVAISLLMGDVYREILFVVFGFSMAVPLQHQATLRFALWPRVDRFLANMSYSLYITHVPVAVFCVFIATKYLAMPFGGYPGLALGLPVFVLTAVMIFLVAWSFSVVFERRTMLLRNYLQSLRLSSPIARYR
jgi:peptidoglycan/LPS O-acetylase OafA/YrhL